MDDEQYAAWEAFIGEVSALMDRSRYPPHVVARLIRETAVAAFVRGAMWGDRPVPGDSEMMRQARETAQEMPDLYPAWRALERNTQ